MRFKRAKYDKDQKLSWRWHTLAEQSKLIALELLADSPNVAGGVSGQKVKAHALAVAHCSDLSQTETNRPVALDGRIQYIWNSPRSPGAHESI